MPKPIPRFRSIAYIRQSGKCYYCDFPMWTDDPMEFARRYGITGRQAQLFQCTAEHLTACQDGGRDTAENVVAACYFCNQRRHKRKAAPSPDRYRQLVQARLSCGRWHVLWVFHSIRNYLNHSSRE